MKDAYALAIVVGRRAPVSSHLGDRAIIHGDGRMDGFIGGACSRDIVRKAALESIATGEPRLLSIDPMSCASEGAIDVYVEPELPAPRLLVAGFTPVAQALTHIAPKAGFTVTQFVAQNELQDAEGNEDATVLPVEQMNAYLAALPTGIRAAAAGLAVTQGHYDEQALAAYLHHGIGFVGLLASEKRGKSIVEALIKQGANAGDIARIRYPVGLDIGARKPADVSISIFAQIVAERSLQSAPPESQPVRETAIDPVCGMSVDPAGFHDSAEYKGRIYYFCGSHCSAAFAAEPEQYVTAHISS